jgi:hypothetical protein
MEVIAWRLWELQVEISRSRAVPALARSPSAAPHLPEDGRHPHQEPNGDLSGLPCRYLFAKGPDRFRPDLAGWVSASLGKGVIDYQGLQSQTDPFLTIWRFRLYGGVVLSGDPRAPGEASAQVWALSVRNRPRGLFESS